MPASGWCGCAGAATGVKLAQSTPAVSPPHHLALEHPLSAGTPIRLMFELRVLGPPSITRGDGSPVEALSRQPRRLALLAYLAVTRPSARRDKLLALFWPESDDAHARAALNQALYFLRNVLGQHAFSSSGNGELVLNSSVVSSDVARFETALATGRHEDALALYRGDLLDGLFISDAPEFERWVEDARARLRDRAAAAAWAAAETSVGAGRTIEAERWARAAADLMPSDEAVVRRLMTFLERLGDGAAAIRTYEGFSRRLARELELHPSAETQELAERIRQNQRGHPPVPSPIAESAHVQTGTKHGRRRLRPVWLLSAAALAAAALVATSGLVLRPPHAAPARTRFPLNFEGQPALAGIGGNTVALSPDGDHLVYLGRGATGDQLFLRRMSVVEAVSIPETRDARHPFFSPDGEWLGYVVGNAIRKVRVGGGPAVTIARITTNVPGISWGDNDTIVFATPSGLWQVPASGGEPAPFALSDTARGELFRWPHVLPGGTRVLFTRIDRGGFHLAAVTGANGEVVPLGIRGTSPRFVAPANLVYARDDGVLLSARFDPRTLRLRSDPVPVTDGVYVGVAGAAKLGVSRTGVLAYVPKPEGGRLLLLNGDGRADTVRSGSLRFYSPRFSPDGRLIATSVWSPDGSQDLWVIDAAGTTMRRITFDSSSVTPVWSRDGRRVAYASKPAGRRFGWAIRSSPLSGSAASPELLVAPALDQFPGSLTRGDTLAFERGSLARKRDIWVVALTGARIPVPYLDSPHDERSPAVSPDGRWLAYVSDESGRDEVYVASFPRAGAPLQVSSDGGGWPRWASELELAYQTSDGIAGVGLRESSGVLRVGARRSRFRADSAVIPVEGLPFDVRGRSLAVFLNARKPVDIMVLMNWFDDPPLSGPPARR